MLRISLDYYGGGIETTEMRYDVKAALNLISVVEQRDHASSTSTSVEKLQRRKVFFICRDPKEALRNDIRTVASPAAAPPSQKCWAKTKRILCATAEPSGAEKTAILRGKRQKVRKRKEGGIWTTLGVDASLTD